MTWSKVATIAGNKSSKRKHKSKTTTLAQATTTHHLATPPSMAALHESAARAARAKATHKPSNVHVQAKATHSEVFIHAALKQGKHVGGNAPLDIVTRIGKKLHGVEVKTLMHNTNAKITMHPASRQRKLDWAASNKAKLHTVVVDSLNNNAMYYRSGVGSFRVKSMQAVMSAAELRRIIRGSKKK